MLSNAYFLAKFCFDTAENEPAKNLQNFANFANPNPYPDLPRPLPGSPIDSSSGRRHTVGAVAGDPGKLRSFRPAARKTSWGPANSGWQKTHGEDSPGGGGQGATNGVHLNGESVTDQACKEGTVYISFILALQTAHGLKT